MSGLYLHIPFCKQACHYCNFHFSTSLKYKDEMVAAIIQEMELQKTYLSDRHLNSIYFGGGTPSLLQQKDLDLIFAQIEKVFTVAPNAEITLEANPDDLNADLLKTLAASPINRLSIGIQSFSEKDLKFMNRAHNALEATQCIELALDAGFEQLTVDLIYGSPSTDDAQWHYNLDKVFAYPIDHLSCYCLTVEEGTALAHFVAQGKAAPVDEERAAKQFEYLLEAAATNGFEQYEISNFARKEQYAKHNTAYWQGAAYLGLGPSAHSFDGKSRRWNVAHNAKYLKGIQQGAAVFEEEILSGTQRYNEYLLTGLRTKWGVSLAQIQAIDATAVSFFQKEVQSFINAGSVLQREDRFTLTQAGKLLADHIASSLFIVD